MALVLAGVVGAVGGNAIDVQQGAVQDHECLVGGDGHGLLEGGGKGGQDLNRHDDVPVDAGQPDPEAGRELGVRVPAAQMGQREQSLSVRGQAAPARAALTTPGLSAGRTGGAGSGWTDRSPLGRQAREAPGGQVDLGRQPIHRRRERDAATRRVAQPSLIDQPWRTRWRPRTQPMQDRSGAGAPTSRPPFSDEGRSRTGRGNAGGLARRSRGTSSGARPPSPP